MATRVQYRLVRSDGANWTVGEGERLSLGRSRQNVVQIADSGVSRQHATLLVARGRCWIRDEDSTHGTFVNGQRVMGQQELREGDVLQIGPATFRLVAVPVSVSVAHQRQRDVVLPPARQRRQGTLLVALAVVIVVLVIAVSFGSFTSRDQTSPEPVEPRESTVLTSGPIDVEPDGTAQVELYDGTQATLHFLDDGKPVEDVEATYVSDETGVTVVAVPQDGEHYPAIRFFPSQQAGRLSPGLASPLRQDVTDITIDFESIIFDESVYVEQAVINLDHLESLPSNMPEWEETHITGEQICGPVAWGLTGAHALIALVHITVSPASGLPHLTMAIVIHTPVHVACELFLGSDPATEYVGAVSHDLAILWPTADMETGIVIGQVTDDETNDGISGAEVRLDGGDLPTHRFTALSNGWYVLTIPGGQQKIWAEAPGYITARMDINVETGKAQLADAIPLIPDAQTQAPECPHQVLTVRGTVQEASSDLVVLEAVEVIEGGATTPADLTEVWVEDIPSGVPVQAGAEVKVRGFMIYHLPDVQGLSVEKEGCTGGYFKVLESSPAPTPTLTPEENLVPIPDVVGLTPDEAESKLKEAGFGVLPGPDGYSNDVAMGHIYDQDPDPGKLYDPKTTVVIIYRNLGRPTPEPTPTPKPVLPEDYYNKMRQDLQLFLNGEIQEEGYCDEEVRETGRVDARTVETAGKKVCHDDYWSSHNETWNSTCDIHTGSCETTHALGNPGDFTGETRAIDVLGHTVNALVWKGSWSSGDWSCSSTEYRHPTVRFSTLATEQVCTKTDSKGTWKAVYRRKVVDTNLSLE